MINLKITKLLRRKNKLGAILRPVWHIKSKCMKWLKRKNQHNIVNNLSEDINLGDYFKPQLKKAPINDVKRNYYLGNTGAGIDLCDRNLIKTGNFIEETTWVRTPLDNECKCLQHG